MPTKDPKQTRQHIYTYIHTYADQRVVRQGQANMVGVQASVINMRAFDVHINKYTVTVTVTVHLGGVLEPISIHLMGGSRVAWF